MGLGWLISLVLAAGAVTVLLTWPRRLRSRRVRRDQLGEPSPIETAEPGSVVTIAGRLEVTEPIAGPTRQDVERRFAPKEEPSGAVAGDESWAGPTHAAWSLAVREEGTAFASRSAVGLALLTERERIRLEGSVEVVLGSREGWITRARPHRKSPARVMVRALAPGDRVRVEGRLEPLSESYRDASSARILPGFAGRVRAAAETLPKVRAGEQWWRLVVALGLVAGAVVNGAAVAEMEASRYWRDCTEELRWNGKGEIEQCAPRLRLARVMPWLRDEAIARERAWRGEAAQLVLEDATTRRPDPDRRRRAAAEVLRTGGPEFPPWYEWNGPFADLVDHGAHAFVVGHWRAARSSRGRLAALDAAVSLGDLRALRTIALAGSVGDGYWSGQLDAVRGAWLCALGDRERGLAAMRAATPLDDLHAERRNLRAQAAALCARSSRVLVGWLAYVVLNDLNEPERLLPLIPAFEPGTCLSMTLASPSGDQPIAATAFETAAQTLARRADELGAAPRRSKQRRLDPIVFRDGTLRDPPAVLRWAAWASWTRASMERLHRGQVDRSIADLTAAEALGAEVDAYCTGTIRLLSGDARGALRNADESLRVLAGERPAPNQATEHDRREMAASLLRARALIELGRLSEIEAGGLPPSLRAQLALRVPLAYRPGAIPLYDDLPVIRSALNALKSERARTSLRWTQAPHGPNLDEGDTGLLARADALYVHGRLVDPPFDPEVLVDRFDGSCHSRECMHAREIAASWRGSRRAQREWSERRARLNSLARDEDGAALVTFAELVLEDALRYD